MSWSTAKEKDFIDNMGSFAQHNGDRRPYLERLIGIERVWSKRQRLGNIDRWRSGNYVEYRIAADGSKAEKPRVP